MQDTKKFAWEFGLNSTDLTNALREIFTAVQAVDDTLKNMGKSVKTTFDGLKSGGKSAVNEIDQLGSAINKSFSQINKDIENINKSVRQADMSKWEKMADNYAVKLSAAQKRLESLTKESEKLNQTEEQRIEIAKKLADAQEKVNRLESAQQAAASYAAQQAAAKQAAKDSKEAAKETAKAAREAAAEQAKSDRERERSAKQAAAEAVRSAREITRELERAAKAQAAEISNYEKALTKAFNSIEKDLDGINKSMRQADMSRWEKMADNYAMKLQKAEAVLKELKDRAEDLNTTEEERIRINQRIADTQEKIVQLSQRQKDAVDFAKQKDAAEGLKQAYSGVKDSLQEIATIGAVVSGALVGVIGSSAREFADFESKLTTFKAVSGATADEVSRFKDLSRSMAEFGKTSTEVAGLGVELSKAGLSAGEIEKGIKQITLAAVATGEELQSTGETVDAVRSQFGLTADEFDRVSNGLVLAANSSKISITDLAESYKYVGSTAKQTGQSLETMNGILAILGNEGIKGSQAGTGLKNVLLKLADPKVTEALKAIKVESVDANGNIRNLTDVVIDLQKGLSGVNQASKVSFLKKQFGEEALVPLLSLLGKTEAELRSSEKAMKNWTGTSEKMAKEMNQGLLPSFNQMKASVQILQQVFIEAMAPALTMIVNAVKGMADAFVGLPKPMQAIIANGTLVVSAIAAITTGVLAFAFAANSGIMALGSLSNALVAFATGAPAVAGGITGIGTALKSVMVAGGALPGMLLNLGKVFAASIGSLTALLGPFIALAAALYFAWEYNLGGFKDIMLKFVESAQELLGMFMDGLSSTKEFWDMIFIGMQDSLYAFVGFIDIVLRGIFTTVDVLFRAIADVMFGNFSGAWEAISGLTANAANAILRMTGSFFKRMGDLFKMAWKGLVEMALGGWDAITNPTNAGAGLQRMEAGLGMVAGAASRMGGVIKEAWNGAFSAVYKGSIALRDHGQALMNIDRQLEQSAKKTQATRKAAGVTEVPGGGRTLGTGAGAGRGGAGGGAAGTGDTKASDELIKQIEKKYDDATEKQNDFIDKNTKAGESIDELNAKIAQTAVKFAQDVPGAIRFQKSVAGIGYTCARTVTELLRLSGVTKDFTKELGFSGVNVYGWTDKLIKAGMAVKVAIKDIKAGDLVVYENRSILKGHIGVAVSPTQAVHASSQAGKRHGLVQLAAQSGFEGAFTGRGGEAFGLRFTEKAFKEGMLGENKELKKAKAEAELIKKKIEEYHAVLKSGKFKEASADYKNILKQIETAEKEYVVAVKKAKESEKKALEELRKREQELYKERLEELKKFYDAFDKQIEESTKNISNRIRTLISEFTAGATTQSQKAAEEVFSMLDQNEALISDLGVNLTLMTQRAKDFRDNMKGKGTAEQQEELNKLLAQEEEKRKSILAITELIYGLDTAKEGDTDRVKNLKAVAEERKALQEDIDKARAQLNQGFEGTDKEQKARRQQALADITLMIDRMKELDQTLAVSSGLIFAESQRLAQVMFDEEQAKAAETDKRNMERFKAILGDQTRLISLYDEINQQGLGLTRQFERPLLDQLAASMKLTDNQKERLAAAIQQAGAEASIAKLTEATNKQAETLKNNVTAIGGLVIAATSGFGEFGQAISQVATGAGSVVSAFIDAGKAGKDLTTIMADPTGMTAVITIATKALEILSAAIGFAFEQIVNYDKAVADIQDARIRVTKEKDIAMRRDLLEIQKESGRATLEQELQLINDEAELRQDDIAKRARELQERGRGRSFLGMFSTLEDEKKFRDEANALDKEQFDNQRERDKARGEAEKADNERRRNALLAQDQAYYDRQEALAAQTADQLDDLDAQHNRNRYDIYLQFEDDKKTAQQNGVTDFFDLEQTRDAKLKALDADTARQRIEIQNEAQRTRLEMQFDHQQTLLEIEGETFENSIKLRENARDKEAAMIELEMALYEKGSLEYQRLEQQKSDAVLKANAEIRKSTDEMRLERERQMQDMAIQIRQLQAELSGDAARATRVGIAKGFFDLAIEEADAIKDARARFENSQEVINRISEFYGLQREKKSRELFQEGLKATRDAYAADQEKLLARQTAPLQRIIDKEEARIKKLQAQNAELERANQLIDARYAKEQERFDLEDKRRFQAALGGINTQDILRQGIEYLANENIINGGILDRTSRETQTRGAMELLDLQEQQANSKLKLEDISKTEFLNEMTRINLMRARLLQEQIADTTNEKEKADLQARFADLYVNYQKDQKDAIDERRKAETYANDQMILNNNRLKTEAENTANVHRTKLEEMKAASEANLSAIDARLAQASMTTSGWLNSLTQIAPTLAQQVQAAVGSIAKIREEFSKPITISVQQQSYSPYGSTNPSGVTETSTSSGLTPVGELKMLFGVPIRVPAGYAEGGVIPDGYPNDTGIVRVSSGERILQSAFNRRMENMLNFFEAPGGFSAQSVNINVDVSSDVDLAKLETVFDKHLRQRESLGVRRWGVNSMSRN